MTERTDWAGIFGPIQGNAMTRAEFLLARIAEDEHAAPCEAKLATTRPRGTGPAHTAFTPDRVLAVSKAHRQIVNVREDFDINTINPLTDDAYWLREGAMAAFDDVIGFLASVYSDHPDYRDAWRP